MRPLSKERKKDLLGKNDYFVVKLHKKSTKPSANEHNFVERQTDMFIKRRWFSLRSIVSNIWVDNLTLCVIIDTINFKMLKRWVLLIKFWMTRYGWLMHFDIWKKLMKRMVEKALLEIIKRSQGGSRSVWKTSMGEFVMSKDEFQKSKGVVYTIASSRLLGLTRTKERRKIRRSLFRG